MGDVKRLAGFEGYARLFCVDEGDRSVNPTGTFKDRQPHALWQLLPERFSGRSVVIAAMSTGNTAFSLIHFANTYRVKRGGDVRVVIFIPKGLDARASFGPDTQGRLIPSRDYLNLLRKRATVIELDFGKPGDDNRAYLSTLRLARAALDAGALDDLNGDAVFLNLTEGLDHTAPLMVEQIRAAKIGTFIEADYGRLEPIGVKAYQPVIVEALESLKQQGETAPDYVVCQFGAGILYNELKDYLSEQGLATKIIPVAVGDARSCADKIYASYWVHNPDDLLMGGCGTSRHDGARVYGVDDWEIGSALRAMRGVLDAEASGVAGLAMLHRLETICPELDRAKHSVLVINTGNGLANFHA